MVKIQSVVVVLVCFAIRRLLQKNTNLDAGERITQVLNATSTAAYEFNVERLRKEFNRSLLCENRNPPLENIQYRVNESNEHDSDFKVKDMSCETEDAVLLDKAKFLVEEADARSNFTKKNMKIVFDEKAREDGFRRTSPEEAPYAVLLRMLYGGLPLGVCSGSLITPRWVITAAHCFNMVYDQVIVYAGGNSVQELDDDEEPEGSVRQYQREVFTHPMYTGAMKGRYDVALVEVMSDFDLTTTINTVELSLGSWRHWTYKDCELTGFGRVYSGDWSVLDNTRKSHFLEVSDDCECLHIKKLVMCSKPKDDYGICSGDSGGGLICDGKLVAVAVGTIAFDDIDTCTLLGKHMKQECGVRNTLNVFQQICPYMQWISSHDIAIDQASIDVQCYDPTRPVDYGDGYYYYRNDDEYGSNVDITTRTSKLLLLTCSLVLLISPAVTAANN